MSVQEYFEILQEVLENPNFDKIEKLNELEIKLSRQYLDLNPTLWEETNEYAVIDLTPPDVFTFHGFPTMQAAVRYSESCQIEKYNSNSNPYYIGHVFSKNKSKQKIHDLL